MYAVIESGGKQHRVRVGDVVRVEALAAQAGDTIAFDRVLMVGAGDESRVGTPTLAGAKVTGTVVELGRSSKVIGYVFKHRKNSNRKRWGHRQDFTAVKIEAIEA